MQMLNIPIALTWVRIAMIPILVALYYVPADWMSVAVRDTLAMLAFVVASLTDWLDGWLARRWGQTTAFGAFLDPVADKLMVSASLLVLLDLGRIDALVVLLIIGREITITALREWMATMGARASVAVHWLGKVKTVAQMVAIPMLLFGRSLWVLPIVQLGTLLAYVAALLTLWSMLYYLHKAWPALRGRAS